MLVLVAARLSWLLRRPATLDCEHGCDRGASTGTRTRRDALPDVRATARRDRGRGAREPESLTRTGVASVSFSLAISKGDAEGTPGGAPSATLVYGAMNVPPKMSELPNVVGQSLFGAGFGSGVAVVSA
jgi:hypothetical protein